MTVVNNLLEKLVERGFEDFAVVGGGERREVEEGKEELKETAAKRVTAVTYEDIGMVEERQFKILMLDDSVGMKESCCFSLLHRFNCDKLLLSGDASFLSIGRDYLKFKPEKSLFSRLYECKGCSVALNAQYRVSVALTRSATQ